MKRGLVGLMAVLGVVVVGLMVAAPQAQAITFFLTSDHCSGIGGCGTPPFGSVTLTQNGTTVDITVELFGTNRFVKTGSADFQNFKFNGTGVALADITVDAHVPPLIAQTGAFNGDGTGDFDFGITCLICANGGAGSFSTDIVFHVANATIADLTVPNNLGNVFVVDMLSGETGNTGPVDATGPVPGLCNKSGRKFNDIPGQPGLAGWQICLFDSVGTLGPCQVTGVNGAYAFTDLACGEEFTFCEVLQPGWTQTFPTLPSADPRIVSCQGLVGPGPLGPVGYQETLVQDVPSENNDFGNEGECPKFPDLTPNVTITIDPGNATQIQDAINQLLVDQTLLILPHLGKKTENITINKRVNVVGCSITLTAAHSSSPVVDITPDANGGLTKDVHATGSTVAGYKIETTTKHTIQNVRSFGNAIGFWITGNSSLVNGALGTTGNGIGFKIDGNNNTLDTNNGVEKNLGDGVLITGDNNTVKKYTVRSNGGNGIKVEATANGTILSDDKAYTNALNGYQVLGTNTKLSKNTAADNGGCEFLVAAGNTNGKDNKANNVTILPNVVGPFPTGCIDP